jgi:hypothetical protein
MRQKAGRRRPLPGGDARAPADSILGPCGMDPRPQDARRDEVGGPRRDLGEVPAPGGMDLRSRIGKQGACQL